MLEHPHLMPFRTISAMVNAECNLKCAHCDLPRRFDRYTGALRTSEWEELIDVLLREVRPEVVSVAAMEPLLPKTGQPKTAAILKAASRHGTTTGLVTNGMYAADFFNTLGKDLCLDFFDLSVDGPIDINSDIRGEKHFAVADHFLQSNHVRTHAKRTYISCTLTKLSAHDEVLGRFLDWICSKLREPRLALLLLYPNRHVRPDLILDDEDLLRVLDLLVLRSSEFTDIFLDIFPSSLPGFVRLVQEGVLPSELEVLRDSSGILWGHVAEKLFVRYQNKHDLTRYNLRISPEGFALPARNFERADYLTGTFGNIRQEGWRQTADRILKEVSNETVHGVPSYCRGLPCVALCGGENERCIMKIQSDNLKNMSRTSNVNNLV